MVRADSKVRGRTSFEAIPVGTLPLYGAGTVTELSMVTTEFPAAELVVRCMTVTSPA
jgi:hypothetical protein